MSTLIIRKRSLKTWVHTDSILGDFIISKFYFNADNVSFQIVEQGQSRRVIYNITDITLYDTINGGSAETFSTITALSLRLEQLNYPAFQQDGEITSIANLIEGGDGVEITGDGTEASPYIINLASGDALFLGSYNTLEALQTAHPVALNGSYAFINQTAAADLVYYFSTDDLSWFQIPIKLENLTDVELESPSNGQVITYNDTTNKWENQTISTGTPTLQEVTDNGGNITTNDVILNGGNLQLDYGNASSLQFTDGATVMSTIIASGGNFSITDDETTGHQFSTDNTELTDGDKIFATREWVGDNFTTPTLQEVTDVVPDGNVTTNNIKIAGLELYDGANDNYSSLTFSDGSLIINNAVSGFQTYLDTSAQTDSYSYQFPDQGGVFALTSDVPPFLSAGQNITIVSDVIDVDIPPIVNTSSILGTTGDGPLGITVDSSGNIYTANGNSNTVTKITPSGFSSPLAITGFVPSGIVIDSLGNVYTANSVSDNVTKITPAGVSTPFGSTGSFPSAITIDSSGNIYTANRLSSNVTKITPAGVSTPFGTTDVGPRGITIDSSGNIYTANGNSNTVTKITPAGVSTNFSTFGSASLGITIDSLGNIYTANNNSNTVTKITPAGVSTILGSTGVGPRGITVDSLDNVYTCNETSNDVTKITPAGVSTTYGTTGSFPSAITIDSSDNIYVSSIISDNVTKITPDTRRILAVDDNLNIIRVDGSGGGGGVTSVDLTMPSAFTVSGNPVTSSGTLAVTAAGTASQYVRGDGQLATFPSGGGGGGSSVNYYLNGSIAASVATYRQMSNTAIIGAGTDFTKTGNGLIAQFLTDIGNPNRLEIPGGAWNFEMFFSMSSGGGSPKFYVELLKYDGTTFTSIASTSAIPETISGGTPIDLYLTSLSVPTTALLVTDRLAIRVYIVDNSGGRTATLHTEDSHLCEIITTFAGGVTSLNGLTANTQYFDVGTGDTNFNISSSGDTHTFNLLLNIRRNANNSSNNNINYNGYAVTGSAESSAVWTITRLTIAASGSITIATATNVAWTNRESATYI